MVLTTMTRFPKMTVVRVLMLVGCAAVGVAVTFVVSDWINYGLGAGVAVLSASLLGQRWRRIDAESGSDDSR